MSGRDELPVCFRRRPATLQASGGRLFRYALEPIEQGRGSCGDSMRLARRDSASKCRLV